MITEIIEPQSATYVLHLPQEYVNQRVEVSIALATDKPLAPEPPRRPREAPSHLRNRGKILGDIISPAAPAEAWDCVRECEDIPLPRRPREAPAYLQIRELPDDIDSLSAPIEDWDCLRECEER